MTPVPLLPIPGTPPPSDPQGGFRGLQPTPAVVTPSAPNASRFDLPDPESTTEFGATPTPGFPDLRQEIRQFSEPNDGEAVEIVPFGDTDRLRAELADPGTEIVYLMPDEAQTPFLIDSPIIIYHDVVIHGNYAHLVGNAILTGPMLVVETGVSVQMHHVTIRNATNDGSGLYGYYGGAITNRGSLQLFDSEIAENSAIAGGGGINNIGGQLLLERVSIRANQAGGGAGIQNDMNGSVTAICSRFISNGGDYGGGILNGQQGNASGNITVSYSVFDGNYGQPGARVDIHNLMYEYVTLQAYHNWWGNDNNTPSVSSGVSVNPKLSDDPTLPPYIIQPQCQPQPAQMPDFCVIESVPTVTTIEDIESYLASYGVNIIDASNTNLWSFAELEAVQHGVLASANAFCLLSNELELGHVTPQQAFQGLLLLADTDKLHFSRTLSHPYNCLTKKLNSTDLDPRFAEIECGDEVQLSEYTITHELGHVFLYRSTYATAADGTTVLPCPLSNGVGFIGCMDDPNFADSNPNSNASRALRGANSQTQFVFGFITRRLRPTFVQSLINNFDPTGLFQISSAHFPPTICANGTRPPPSVLCSDEFPLIFAEISDWERGVTGWDVPIPVNAPDRFGACDDVSGVYVITSFQQNPCVIYEWVLEHPAAINVGDVGLKKTTEQEEAGADMFLNWVYRSVEGVNSLAFSDNENVPTGRVFEDCELVPAGHGDDRFCWMRENLRLFFQYHDW
ncbi:MAG: hypothetical protein H3C32_10175 [Anaerolineae bacterium]|nr:hypothetical protein [Anaerolineae bacterium]GIK30096.1 MAG: hypothetical protein BroJett007_32340 [Chloroflexota bacterium]